MKIDQQTIIINPEYEGLSNEALLNLSNWVHHVPYILPQGRVTFENPIANAPKNGEDGEEEEGSDDEGAGDGNEEPVEPETGPAILTSLAADAG